jgi:hypothetical protein
MDTKQVTRDEIIERFPGPNDDIDDLLRKMSVWARELKVILECQANDRVFRVGPESNPEDLSITYSITATQVVGPQPHYALPLEALVDLASSFSNRQSKEVALAVSRCGELLPTADSHVRLQFLQGINPLHPKSFPTVPLAEIAMLAIHNDIEAGVNTEDAFTRFFDPDLTDSFTCDDAMTVLMLPMTPELQLLSFYRNSVAFEAERVLDYLVTLAPFGKHLRQ